MKIETETLRVEEAGQLIGISRASAYRAVKRGEIPSIKIGGLRLVPKVALQELLRNTGKGSNAKERTEV